MTDTARESLERKKLAEARSRQFRLAVAGETIDMYEEHEAMSIPKSDYETRLISESLQAHFLFCNLSRSELDACTAVMFKRSAKFNDQVITQGEEGDRFYVLQRGNVDIIIGGKLTKSLGCGSNFGELALMYNCPRAATVKVTSDTADLWALDRLSFRRFLLSSQLKQRQFVQTRLRHVSIFKELSDHDLGLLHEAMVRLRFTDGTDIITQGEDGNTFYVIDEGQVTVRKDERRVATLRTGQHFGEQALLSLTQRGATITAEGDTVCLVIGRVDFETIVGKITDLQHAMDGEHERRIKREEDKRIKAHQRPLRQLLSVSLSDLDVMQVIGKGAFGMVQLVNLPQGGTDSPYALKVLQKKQLATTKQSANIVHEKQVMHMCDHRFIIKLAATMQDRDCLYLLMEFLQGGDLFSLLCDNDGSLCSSDAKYYAACVVSAFTFLHSMDVVYRDLKPENLVLDRYGTVKVVDFGMAKIVPMRTYTVCGTPEYMAPEVISGRGHHKAVDYWALGVLIYEMLTGVTPFADPMNNHLKVYKSINRGKVIFPRWITDGKARDLMTQLLTRQPHRRIGCLREGAAALRAHDWFSERGGRSAGEFFQMLEEGRIKPAMIPIIASASLFDTSAFDDWGLSNDYIVAEYTATGLPYEAAWDAEFTMCGSMRRGGECAQEKTGL